MVGEADPDDASACEVVLTWTQFTGWPILEWSTLSLESYGALDRLIGHLVRYPDYWV